MDPLSITASIASIASILTLTVQLASTSEELYLSIKERPLLLKAISTDLKHLHNILTQLENTFTRRKSEDNYDILPVLRHVGRS